jgi:hypothetical protein
VEELRPTAAPEAIAAASQATTAPDAGTSSEKFASSDQSQRAAATLQNSCD